LTSDVWPSRFIEVKEYDAAVVNIEVHSDNNRSFISPAMASKRTCIAKALNAVATVLVLNTR
jgi:hypothetical protein